MFPNSPAPDAPPPNNPPAGGVAVPVLPKRLPTAGAAGAADLSATASAGFGPKEKVEPVAG
jgi:hypothetical protein